MKPLALAALLALSGLPAATQAETPFEALIARFRGGDAYAGFTSSNGRLEAQSVAVASKYAGRVTEVLVAEGALVEAGTVIARLDDRDTQARMLGAKADVLRARAARQIAEAAVMQAQSTLDVARTNQERVSKLNADGHAAQSVLDDATNALTSAQAALAMAQAQVADADALIEVSGASLRQLEVALDDLTIRAPTRGRVLYRLREPGEVVAAGASIVTLLDLSDVWMNVYLPADAVGRLTLNDEARLILDPIPNFVVPARVTFVSPEAQFTPRSVETSTERQDLVFRVKLTIPRELLERFESQVKAGVRGIGFVRSDPAADWPAELSVKLPE